MPGERMQVSGCELGIEERRLHLCRSARFHFAFDPDLGGPVVLPVGKEADAVPASENVVQVLFEMAQWKVFVDSLRYLECGLDFESHSCDYSQRAEAYHGRLELLSVMGVRNLAEFALCRYELERCSSSRQIAVPVS